jgi:hypothetical protein
MKTTRLRLLMLCAVLPSAIVSAGSYTNFSGKHSFIAADFSGAGYYFGKPAFPDPVHLGSFRWLQVLQGTEIKWQH